MRSSRQRRIISEANGVFDPTGAQPGTIAPPAPAPAPAAPAQAQQPEQPVVPVPKVPTPSSPSPSDSSMKMQNLVQAGDMLADVSAKLETVTAYVRKADGGVAEELDKVRSAIMSCSGGIREKLIDLGQKDPSIADEVRAWLMGQSGAQASAPVAPMPVETFSSRLSAVLEDGVTKERKKTSQECTSAIQKSEHQGSKKGNPPKSSKSDADFAVKNVTGNGYGSANGGFG